LWALDIREGIAPERYWEVEVQRADEAREQATTRAEDAKTRRAEQAVERDMERIRRAAARSPGGETKHVLSAYAGVSGRRLNVALAKLLDEGDLVPCEVPKPNRKTPYEGFKLAE
jgi:hypothetical protein